MKIINALTLMGMIMVASFPGLIKAPGATSGSSGGGGGRGFTGGGTIIGGGFVGGGDIPKPEPSTGFKGGTVEIPKGETSGYLGGQADRRQGGGDTGFPLFIRPKPIPNPGGGNPEAPKITWPPECKPAVRHCATLHIYQGTRGPNGGPCCAKFRAAEPCLCRLLTAKDPKISREANRVLRVCHIQRPVCIDVPMPPQCRPEVRHCIAVHILGGGGDPPHHGACCNKFKTSKSCLCNFHTSSNPKLRRAADGMLRGCHFKKPACPS